jgi:hypothetical protein
VKTEALLDMMKDWLSNAQLVQKSDLERVEKRLDDVLELVTKLEARMAETGQGQKKST